MSSSKITFTSGSSDSSLWYIGYDQEMLGQIFRCNGKVSVKMRCETGGQDDIFLTRDDLRLIDGFMAQLESGIEHLSGVGQPRVLKIGEVMDDAASVDTFCESLTRGLDDYAGGKVKFFGAGERPKNPE